MVWFPGMSSSRNTVDGNDDDDDDAFFSTDEDVTFFSTSWGDLEPDILGECFAQLEAYMDEAER